MLIVFGGLPGTGKTTIAKKLAKRLAATYLRIDSMEQAIIHSGIKTADIGPAGYYAAYAVAADNLRLGLAVIADSVNAITLTRDAWKEVAFKTQMPLLEVEFICSNQQEHRKRIESRKSDIIGHELPNWHDVLKRIYEPWSRDHVVVDTSQLSSDEAVEVIMNHIK